MERARIAVIGSRDFNDFALMCEEMDKFINTLGDVPVDIISGGAKGADTLADKSRNENGERVGTYHSIRDADGIMHSLPEEYDSVSYKAHRSQAERFIQFLRTSGGFQVR